jgi:quercetin dioxygenase-like cupin family protein
MRNGNLGLHSFEGGYMLKQLSIGIVIATLASMNLVEAQQLPAMTQQSPTIKRTPLRTIEFPPGFNTVTAIAEMAGGNCIGRHTHPGIESGYVMEGDITLKVQGKPDQTMKAGESFETPANTIHDACTTAGLKVLATYVVEKGKPLASPAPAQ